MTTDPIHAVFPVRAGSKRVANKNIRPFADSTLLEIKVRQLQQTEDVTEVYVSSESPEMLALAEAAGATPLLRDPAYATDDVPMSEVYAHIAGQLPEGHVLFTHATNPLCGEEAYMDCIRAYREMPEEFDSLTTVLDVKDFLYENGKALNFDPERKPRSQDLPDIVKLTHAVSLAPRSLILEKKNIFGDHPLLHKLGCFESTDIDTELDFKVAEYMFGWETDR